MPPDALIPSDEAAAQARGAATAAGIRVDCLETMAQMEQESELLRTVWRSREPKIAPDLLRALSLSGNYVAAAWADGAMVGALVGFFGSSRGVTHLHSHVLGVLESARGRAVGLALKLHQRAWALEREIDVIVWTTDPLIRRNMHFNLTKLGADVAAYLPNLYGAMHDELNVGEDSDRVEIVWHVARASAAAAAAELPVQPDVEWLRADATVVLSVGPDGEPVVGQQWHGQALLVGIPHDIVALRREDATLARAWRVALRDALGGALAEGYEVEGFAQTGWFVLRRRQGAGHARGHLRFGGSGVWTQTGCRCPWAPRG